MNNVVIFHTIIRKCKQFLAVRLLILSPYTDIGKMIFHEIDVFHLSIHL